MSRHTASLAVAAALVSAVSVGTLSACATHHHVVAVTGQPAAPMAYSPPALGANGMCYYLDDPQEAYNLIAAGLCQPGWRPTLMPPAFHAMYADYLASPAYYNNYVPLKYRGRWETQWGSHSDYYVQNRTYIITQEKQAVYKGSNGATVTASAIPSSKLSFGPGVKPSLSLGSVAPPKPDNTSPTGKLSLGGGISTATKASFGGGVKPVGSSSTAAKVSR